MDTTLDLNEPSTPEPIIPEPSRAQRILKQSPWIALGVVSLILFTFWKLPDTKIRALIQGSLNQQLAQAGISLSAAESELSFIFGPRYIMRSVQVRWSPTTPPVSLQEVRVSPSLFSLLLGRFAGSARIKNQKGVLDLSFHVNGNRFSGSLDSSNFDLGSLGVIQALAKVNASVMVNGSVSIQSDVQSPTALSGDVDLRLTQWKFPAQAIAGFNVPELVISESRLNLLLKNGRVQCTECSFGSSKTGTAKDDLSGNIKGSMDMARTPSSSRINAELRFRVSEKVKQSFVFLESLLPPGSVQSDGSYGMALSGPLDMVSMGPLGAK